jgi:hypothetical protein
VDSISEKEYTLTFLSTSGVFTAFCMKLFQFPTVEWVCFRAVPVPQRVGSSL